MLEQECGQSALSLDWRPKTVGHGRLMTFVFVHLHRHLLGYRGTCLLVALHFLCLFAAFWSGLPQTILPKRLLWTFDLISLWGTPNNPATVDSVDFFAGHSEHWSRWERPTCMFVFVLFSNGVL